MLSISMSQCYMSVCVNACLSVRLVCQISVSLVCMSACLSECIVISKYIFMSICRMSQYYLSVCMNVLFSACLYVCLLKSYPVCVYLPKSLSLSLSDTRARAFFFFFFQKPFY